jgi:hypothetical protein
LTGFFSASSSIVAGWPSACGEAVEVETDDESLVSAREVVSGFGAQAAPRRLAYMWSPLRSWSNIIEGAWATVIAASVQQFEMSPGEKGVV